MFGSLGRLPVVGDRVTAGGGTFIVREMDGRRIETIAVELPKPAVGRDQRPAMPDAAPARAGACTIAAHTRTDSFMLDASANPRPAMSSAVPWSGDVRGNGSPSVTFTALPNAATLMAVMPTS